MTHKYQINERIRVDLPKMGLHDSPGVIHTRLEQEEHHTQPMYNVLVRKTEGIYRVSEDLVRIDPDYATVDDNKTIELDKVAHNLAGQYLARDADSCTLDDYSEEDGEYIRERLRQIAARVRSGSAG